MGCRVRPTVWFRFWITNSAFGNLVWYLVGVLASTAVLYTAREFLTKYNPETQDSAAYLVTLATKENVDMALLVTLLQLALNLLVSMWYRYQIVHALAAISATCTPAYRDLGERLRGAMARRAIDLEFWVREHRDIRAVFNKVEADARKFATADNTFNVAKQRQFEAFRKNVILVVTLYYNPLSVRLFVHSVFAVGGFMVLKAVHHLNQDGLAALPFTLFIGLLFAGILLFIRIADNPCYDDGSGPRIHGRTTTVRHVLPRPATPLSVASTVVHSDDEDDAATNRRRAPRWNR